jgi:plasmid stability protein
MPTLYVENVPRDLYEALRARARSHRRSIAAETISILEQAVPSQAELKRRAAFLERIQRMRSRGAKGQREPSAEQLLREDRDR